MTETPKYAPPLPPEELEEDGPGIEIWQILNSGIRHRYLVLLVGFLFGAVMAGLSLSSARQYDLSIAFIPQEPSSPLSAASQVLGQLGQVTARANPGSPQFYANLLTSRQVLRDVVNTRFTLADPVSFDGTLIEYFGIAERTQNASTLQAMKKLQDYIGVSVDRITGLVRLNVGMTHPELSRQVAERFLQLINDYNLRRRQSQARAEREFVERSLAEAQRNLREAEDNLASWYRSNRQFQGSPELVAQEQRLQRLVSTHQRVVSTHIVNLETARIDEIRNTPVITIVEPPTGIVEPRPRGTAKKAIFAVVVGTLLGILLAFWRDTRLSAARDSNGYREFTALLREAVSSLPLLGRRMARTS